MKIGIIGAGQAGVEAATAVAALGAEAHVFSGEDLPPYYRPRLVALAFGQTNEAAIRMHPAQWYQERGIDLHPNEPVAAFKPDPPAVISADREWSFDGLIVSPGAQPVVPPFAQTAPELVCPLWNVQQARRIQKLARPGADVVVIGGGVLGIETALRARPAGLTVTIVEKMAHLMPAQFSPRMAQLIYERLRVMDIEVAFNCGVRTVASLSAAGPLRLTLDDGRLLEADFAILAIGARPDVTLSRNAGLAIERGIKVNEHLQTSAPRVFAAGDAIQFAGLTRCSAREAVAQGRLAGANAVRAERGSPLEVYHAGSEPLFFKASDLEFYAAGAPGGADCQVAVLDSAPSAFRVLVRRGDEIVGVQMIGTREGFDELAAKIKPLIR